MNASAHLCRVARLCRTYHSQSGRGQMGHFASTRGTALIRTSYISSLKSSGPCVRLDSLNAIGAFGIEHTALYARDWGNFWPWKYGWPYSPVTCALIPTKSIFEAAVTALYGYSSPAKGMI